MKQILLKVPCNRGKATIGRAKKNRIPVEICVCSEWEEHGECMTYTILFLEHERVTRSTSWDTGLDAAKKYACDQLVRRDADRVEVWDRADKLVFRHLTPAPDGQ
jgi:hypothetical protein